MTRSYLKYLNIIILATSLSISHVSIAAAQNQKTDIRTQTNRVINAELKAAFTGQTHAGAYNFTDKGDPRLFYQEHHIPDGRVKYTDGNDVNMQGDNATANGFWQIVDNTMCYLYTRADMSGGCFRVYRVANCYYFYSVNIIEQENELDRDYWTARSTVKGETAQCEAKFS